MRPNPLLALAAVLLLPTAAHAAHCTAGTEVVQSFPTAGPAVSEWRLCYQILQTPDVDETPIGSQTLVLTQVEFRPGPAATPIAVLGDLRMAEIFVPYHEVEPRYFDLTDFAFELQPLTAVECPATRLAGDRVCSEVVDRGLAWRDPGLVIARRGEKLVLWSVLNASNYDYVMRYEFWDDGTIEVRGGATGRKLGGADDPRGHFHNFAWRVNLDVAGAGGDTVHSAGVRVTAQVRDVERVVRREGGIKWDAKAFTHVEVEDGAATNGRGRRVAYALAPVREGVTKFPEKFTSFPLWVTRNHGPASELRARDVATYAADREVVDGQDVVLWYIDSHNHENDMRDEDRDTVPIAWVGFRLEPQNVWDGTPFYP
jgi:hypothetical protein